MIPGKFHKAAGAVNGTRVVWQEQVTPGQATGLREHYNMKLPVVKVWHTWYAAVSYKDTLPACMHMQAIQDRYAAIGGWKILAAQDASIGGVAARRGRSGAGRSSGIHARRGGIVGRGSGSRRRSRRGAARSGVATLRSAGGQLCCSSWLQSRTP
jgi:hypothetical protein